MTTTSEMSTDSTTTNHNNNNSNQMHQILGSPLVMKCMLVFGTIIIAGCSWLFWQYTGSREETDNAFIDGHTIALSPRVAGIISKVYVKDNQLVQEGQLLATLDDNDLKVKVEQSIAAVQLAKAQLEEATASLSQAYTSADAERIKSTGSNSSAQAKVLSSQSAILEADAAVLQQKAKIQSLLAKSLQSKADYERYSTLDKGGAVSVQELEQAKTNFDMASSELEAAKNNLKQYEMKVLQAKAQLTQSKADVDHSIGLLKSAEATYEQTNIIKQKIESAKATLAQAQATLKEDLLQLSYTAIKAPATGRIGRKNLEIGQRVETGQTILAIVSPETWITANFKETQIGRMKPGQEVEIKVDTLAGTTLHGTVESLSPASGAKFALLPPENASGNFTKVVQRLPVKILISQSTKPEIRNKLAPGLSCEVAVIVK